MYDLEVSYHGISSGLYAYQYDVYGALYQSFLTKSLCMEILLALL